MAHKDKNRVTVEIAGQELTLLTDNEPEYVLALAKYVNERIEKILEKNPRLSTSQVALLAAINLADEVFGGGERGEDK